MNQNQKITLIGVIAIFVAMFAYPPFQVVDKEGVIVNMGYGWIFDPPRRRSITAIVNVSMLFIQWIGILVIGGIAFFLVKTSTQELKHSKGESPSINEGMTPVVPPSDIDADKEDAVHSVISNSLKEDPREKQADKGYSGVESDHSDRKSIANREDSPSTSLTSFVEFSLVLLLLTTGVAVVSDWMQLNMLDNISNVTSEAAEANDRRVNFVNWLHIIISIGAWITLLAWKYRMNKNCHLFGAKGMRFSPGWAATWDMIPFMNLFRPYQVMQEIWKVSTDPTTWRDQRGGGLVKWWWFAHITSTVIGQIFLRMAIRSRFSEQTIEQLEIATSMSLFVNCLLIINAVVTIWLLIEIRTKQDSLIKVQNDYKNKDNI